MYALLLALEKIKLKRECFGVNECLSLSSGLLEENHLQKANTI